MSDDGSVGERSKRLMGSMLGEAFFEDAAAKWLGGSVVEKADRYWRIEPEAADVATARLAFENLAHADHVMTTVELTLAEPWTTGEAELVTLFGEERAWLPYEHDTIPKTLVFEVSGDGDAKGTVCVRVERPVDDAGQGWKVPSILLRRIWGPRRA